MHAIFAWLWVIFITATYSSVSGFDFSVLPFGACPNDNTDDSVAIQWAIDTAIKNGSNNIIVFPAGTYDITSPLDLSGSINLTVMGQGMRETLLLGHSQRSIFTADVALGLIITSLSIDFNPLPFTAGYVINVDASFVDVWVVSPHQADVDRQVGAILRYDPTAMRPAFGPSTYEIYQTLPSDRNTSIIAENVLRIPLASPSKFIVGDPVVARYASQYHAISVINVTDLTVQSVTIFASWSMGLVSIRTTRLNVLDYHVTPKPGRWMSTNVDCMHFIDSRESIHLSDSRCEAQGDDGLNVHTPYFIVAQVINSSALVIQTYQWLDLLRIREGTRFEFSTHQQPYTAYTTAMIASSIEHSPDSRVFSFTTPVNVSVDDWVCVADTPSLAIRNFTVANNRARGVLLETRRINMTRSIFNQTSGPAILFQPSLYWYEGPGARNVSLSENLYINCNEGLAQEKGVITFSPYPPQSVPVISDVQIRSSTFLTGPFSLAMIECGNVENLLITGNYIATNNSMPLIWLCNSRQINARNNTVINKQFVMEQYYTYDPAAPCYQNLTSLIDLPPSAFNSSFPPPITPPNSNG